MVISEQIECKANIPGPYKDFITSAKELEVIFKKYRTFSMLIYSYTNMSGNWKTKNCVDTRRPQGGVFSHNFEFFQYSRVLI